jgi:hypothetical protein
MAPVREKSTGKEPQVQPNHPAFPARWCYGLYVLSPVRRAFWPPSPARRERHANLASASGCQDHTTSPSATTSVVCAKECARHRRGHRIPASRVVTIGRNVLLTRRDARTILQIFGNTQGIYFCAKGWTANRRTEVICPSDSPNDRPTERDAGLLNFWAVVHAAQPTWEESCSMIDPVVNDPLRTFRSCHACPSMVRSYSPHGQVREDHE